MKRNLMLLTVALLSSCAMADEGVSLNITGTVRDNTCSVSSDDQSKNVSLGEVSSRQFEKVGDMSPVQPFTLLLEKCSAEINGVTVVFSGQTDPDNPQIFAIDNGAGNASGIGVGIYDQSRTLLPVGETSVSYSLPPGQTSLSLQFYARYIATKDHVVSGNANATATFVVNYA